MSDIGPKSRPTGLERHAQTGLAAIIIGLIAWVGVTLTNTNTELVALKRVTEAQIATLTAGLQDHEHRLRYLERLRASAGENGGG